MSELSNGESKKKFTRRAILGAGAVTAAGIGAAYLHPLEKASSLIQGSPQSKDDVPTVEATQESEPVTSTETPNPPQNDPTPSSEVPSELANAASSSDESIRLQESLSEPPDITDRDVISAELKRMEKGKEATGIKTYGEDKPYSLEDVEKQIDSLVKGEDKEGEPNSFSATAYITESLYASFKNNGAESVEEFLFRHQDTMNGLLHAGKSEARVGFQQIVVVEDSFDKDSLASVGQSLPDNKKGYIFLSGQYDLTKQLYYDENYHVDKSVLRQMGNRILQLPVRDKVFVQSQSGDVPDKWRVYDPAFDKIAEGIMGDYSLKLSRYDISFLQKKLELGTAQSTEVAGYPKDVPKRLKLVFPQEFQGGNFTIMRLTKKDQDTLLQDDTSIPFVVGSKGEVVLHPEDIFPGDKPSISEDDAVIFFKVNKDTKGYVRPINIAQYLNIMSWQGLDNAQMRVPLVGENDEVESGLPLPPIEFESWKETKPQLDDKIEHDGLTTFGSKKGFDQELISNLSGFFNNEQLEMNPDHYYTTLFVNEETYKQFPKDNNESFESTITRHMDRFNESLSEAGVASKVEIRRLVVVDQYTKMPDHYLRDLDIKDSDGGYSIWGRWKLSDVGYYDKERNLDVGLLHEWGHSITHLADHYRFNSEKDFLDLPALQDIPLEWREYKGGFRPDISKDIMSCVAENFNVYCQNQLRTRMDRGEIHDRKKGIHDIYGFPADMPDQVTIDPQQDDVGNSSVEVFQSRREGGGGSQKKLLELKTTLSADKKGKISFNPADFFKLTNEGFVASQEGMLLLKYKKPDSTICFRWMDVRDFNLALWEGKKDHTVMQLNLASENDHPDTFDWTIAYK